MCENVFDSTDRYILGLTVYVYVCVFECWRVYVCMRVCVKLGSI